MVYLFKLQGQNLENEATCFNKAVLMEPSFNPTLKCCLVISPTVFQIIVSVQEALIAVLFFARGESSSTKISAIGLSVIVIVRLIYHVASSALNITTSASTLFSIVNSSPLSKQQSVYNKFCQQITRIIYSKFPKFILITLQLFVKLSLLTSMITSKNLILTIASFYFIDDKTLLLGNLSDSIRLKIFITIISKIAPAVLLSWYLYTREERNVNSSTFISGSDLLAVDLILLSTLVALFILSDIVASFIVQIQENGRKVLKEVVQQTMSFSMPPLQSSEKVINYDKVIEDQIKSDNFDMNCEKIVSKQIFVNQKKGSYVSQLSPLTPGMFPNMPSQPKVAAQSTTSSTTSLLDLQINQEEFKQQLIAKDILELLPNGAALVDIGFNLISHNNMILNILDCEEWTLIKEIINLSTGKQPSATTSHRVKTKTVSSNPISNRQKQSGTQLLSQLISQPQAAVQFPIAAVQTNLVPQGKVNSISQFALKKFDSSIDNIQSSALLEEDIRQLKISQRFFQPPLTNHSITPLSALANNLNNNINNNNESSFSSYCELYTIPVRVPSHLNDEVSMNAKTSNEENIHISQSGSQPISSPFKIQRDVSSGSQKTYLFPQNGTSSSVGSNVNSIRKNPNETNHTEKKRGSLNSRGWLKGDQNINGTQGTFARCVSISDLVSEAETHRPWQQATPEIGLKRLETQDSRGIDLIGGKGFEVTYVADESKFNGASFNQLYSDNETSHGMKSRYIYRDDVQEQQRIRRTHTYLREMSRSRSIDLPSKRSGDSAYPQRGFQQISSKSNLIESELKQRDVRVGQIMSQIFDEYNQNRQKNRSYIVPPHINEILEVESHSSYSRNPSLLGQIFANDAIGYVQRKDGVICFQVTHKGKQLIVKLVPCISQSQNQQHFEQQHAMLVVVETVWTELFDARIDASLKSKMRLFGSLCHELRTPLNCSISFLDMYRQLKEGSDQQDDVDEFVEPSLRSNQMMLNMVNDILDYVQLTENKFKFSPQKFNLIDLLNECLLMVRIPAKVKCIELQLIRGSNVRKNIKSDSGRIRQIILNFLSNALKFTLPNGKITLSVENSINEEEEKQIASSSNKTIRLPNILKICVSDTGVGISKQKIRNIFQIFNKSTTNKNSELNPTGCGIGLPLSNSLAKLMAPTSQEASSTQDGQYGVQVTSVEGQGSSFSFLIFDHTDDFSRIDTESNSDEKSENKDYGRSTNSHISNSEEDKEENQFPQFSIASDFVGGRKVFSFMKGNQQECLQSKNQRCSLAFTSMYDPSSNNQNLSDKGFISNPFIQENKGRDQVSYHERQSQNICVCQSKNQFSINSIPMREGPTGSVESMSINKIAVKSYKQLLHMPTQDRLLEKKSYQFNSRGEETRILIADDSGFNVMVLKKIIELYHIRDVQVCYDGQQALAKVKDLFGKVNSPNEKIFDVIFMDIDMPLMNGYEACKAIKQLISSQNRQIPIVACSSFGEDIKHDSIYNTSQLDEAISKPIKKDQIIKVLDKHIRML